MSSHSNKSDFMQFLIEKCHFGNKKTKWACYWVERFEQLFPDWAQDREHAIEAFNDLLCKRKSDIVINWALQADSASGRRCSMEKSFEAMVSESYAGRIVGNVSRDSTAIAARGKPLERMTEAWVTHLYFLMDAKFSWMQNFLLLVEFPSKSTIANRHWPHSLKIPACSASKIARLLKGPQWCSI